jgi:hypothetical protein
MSEILNFDYPRIESDQDLQNHDPKVLFKDYYKFEKYDPSKQYVLTEFVGNTKYEVQSVVVYDEKDDTKKELYVVWSEYITEEERNKLILYCSCTICSADLWDLNYMFACRHCYGCMSAGCGFNDPSRVSEARKRLAEAENKLQFKTIKHLTVDMNTFNPHTYLSLEERWEVYNPTVIYSKQYNIYLKLLVVTDDVYPDVTESYVIWKHVISDDERKRLIPYCQCKICTLPFWNLSKYISSGDKYGCLKFEDSDDIQVLESTRDCYISNQ